MANFRAVNPSSRVGRDDYGNTPASLLTAGYNYTGLPEAPPIVPVPRTVFLFRNNIVGGFNYITQERISNILAFGAAVEPSSITDYKIADMTGVIRKDQLVLKPISISLDPSFHCDEDQVMFNMFGAPSLAFRSTPTFDRYMVDYIYRRRGGVVLIVNSSVPIPQWLSDIATEYRIPFFVEPDVGYRWQSEPTDIITLEFSTIAGRKKLSVEMSIPTLTICYTTNLWTFLTQEVPDPWNNDLSEVMVAGETVTITLGPSQVNILDDGNILIPMGAMEFNFFGQRRDLYWNSNNAITFGLMSQQGTVSLSCDTVPAILLGNYDRILKSFHTLTREGPKFSTTEILVEFFNYYTDDTTKAPSYTWIIKLIKENVGPQRQYIEVSIGSKQLPDAGYSSARVNYPSGSGVDSKNRPIDPTKTSPFNITNGTEFLNTFGQTYMNAAPPANSSFVLWSDSTGTNWSFVDKAHVRL